MAIVWSVRNSASPQELQSQELGGKRQAWKEAGKASIAIHQACAPPPSPNLAH